MEVKMAAKTLTQKLKLKAGARAAVLNPPPGYLESLRPLPGGLILETNLDGSYDWVQVFVANRAELAELIPGAIKALQPSSLLWISFPKGTSKLQTDLTRDRGWEALAGVDLRWVHLVSVNDTWSAFCLRPYREGEERRPPWR
jgi:hypothetical protein